MSYMETNSKFNTSKVFKDRDDAVSRLLEILPLKELENRGNNIVVSISTGGVLFASTIAKKLNAGYDFLFTESITAPSNPECQIAMVSESEEIVIHEALMESFGINLDYIYGEAKRKHEEKILKYIYKYRKGELISSLTNKNVLLVDEGIDSGLTMMAAIKTAIEMRARSISLISPVIPCDVAERLDELIDDIYYIYKPQHFVDVEYYYEHLPEIQAKEIEEMLKDEIIRVKNL